MVIFIPFTFMKSEGVQELNCDTKISNDMSMEFKLENKQVKLGLV